MADEVGWGDQEGFESPEVAALAGYHDGEGAHILRIDVISDDEVDVIVDTEPSHPMRVHCVRDAGLWYEAGEISE